MEPLPQTQKNISLNTKKSPIKQPKAPPKHGQQKSRENMLSVRS